MKILGIDPGTVSFDLCLLDDDKVTFEDSIPSSAVAERPEDFLAKTQANAEFMNAKQLRQYIRGLSPLSQRHIRRLTVDWHNRFAFPLSTFILTLVGIPFALQIRKGRMAANLGMGLGVGTLYYFVLSIALALGKGGFLPPSLAAWVAPALFLFLGSTLLKQIPS